MNRIWAFLEKDRTVQLIAVIAILLIAMWMILGDNRELQDENDRLVRRVQYLEDRQVKIDHAILRGIISIYAAMPQSINYMEVSHE